MVVHYVTYKQLLKNRHDVLLDPNVMLFNVMNIVAIRNTDWFIK